MSNKYLNDPEYLFSIVTMLVKKNGGKITITEEEMKNVSKGDLIGMYYEPKTGNLILKEVEAEDMLQATSIVREKEKDEKVYDN
jgi:ABC-type lipopolysaccharide export system ATPase subunit